MKKLSTMLLAGVLAIGPMMVGCSVSDDDDTGPGDLAASDAAGTFADGDAPLDGAQSALNDALADQLASQASDVPGGEAFIQRLTYALLFLLEGPDEILAALATGDPEQLGAAGSSLASNTTMFADQLLCAINSLASENCESLSEDGVPGEFQNLETVLIMLGIEADKGDEADFDLIFQLLEDGATELEMALADSESSFAGNQYAESLLQLLSVYMGDNADLFAALGEEDSEAANDAFVASMDNLLENLVIGLPQLAEQNPELADQVENELQIVTDGINSYSIDLFPLLIDLFLDPISDLLGGFGGV